MFDWLGPGCLQRLDVFDWLLGPGSPTLDRILIGWASTFGRISLFGGLVVSSIQTDFDWLEYGSPQRVDGFDWLESGSPIFRSV